MPRATRRAPVRGSRGRIAPSWTYTQSSAPTTVAAGSITLLATFTPATEFDVTVLRTRAHIEVFSDQSAGVEFQCGAFGMCVVSDRAAAAGVASLPRPSSDGGDDIWFLHQPFMTHGTAAISAFTNWMDLDSKAMRKVENGQVIVVLVENFSGTTGLLFQDSIRVLAKLTQN